jgi:hypothetical protein
MKYFLFFLLIASCASNPNNASYKEEKNVANFENAKSFNESPETILLAAMAVLDELQQQSDPPVGKTLKSDSESIQTGWVYSSSKNKYVEFTMNGKPKRKPLKVRRKYGYTAIPSLAGSQVVFQVEEEVMKVDFKTGEDSGWSSEDTDKAVYDFLHKKLVEKLRIQ